MKETDNEVIRSTRAALIEKLEAELCVIHAGIMVARDMQITMKDLLGMPFFPIKTMPIADAFKAVNSVDALLKGLKALVEEEACEKECEAHGQEN